MISLMYCLLNRNTIDVYPNRKKKKQDKRQEGKTRGKREEAREADRLGYV